MNYRTTRRLIAAGTSIAAALGLLPVTWMAATPTAAASSDVVAGDIEHTIGGSVTAALVAAAGPVATVDYSTTTDCMSGTDLDAVAYRTDRVVLRTWLDPAAAADRVRTALREVGSPAEITGVETITLNDLPGGDSLAPVVSVSFATSVGEPVPIVGLARRLRQYPIPASPDYLLSPSSGPSEFWPGGPPKPTDRPAPQRAAGLGAGTTVVVYDGGVASPLESNNPPNLTRLSTADKETLDAEEPYGVVDHYYSGHTTVISDVIATLAPGAAVVAARITDASGVATDVSAARRMATTLRGAHQAGAWPDLIVNAFGSSACQVDPARPDADMPPLGLQLVAEAVDRHDQALVVASAGNRSTSRRFYPAAFPTVVAVGALDTTTDADGSAWTAASRSGTRADFSNYGDWVDAFAPGVDLAARHVDGFRFAVDGPVIKGLALVRGTSYAAPYVAALIAEQMAAAGQRADAAWAAIAASGAGCSAANGSGVAVALGALTDTATTKPAPGTVPAC